MRHSFFSLAVASAVAVCAFASCNGKEQQALVQTDDDAILHAWSWSFDTIAANMKNIADAGFAYVQTSPVNTCFVGEDGGMALFSEDGDSVKGKWYYYYQPVDWQIGNYLLGSERQFKSMMDSAARYGVKVAAQPCCRGQKCCNGPDGQCGRGCRQTFAFEGNGAYNGL